MARYIATATAFDGALSYDRHSRTWRWNDGTEETRVYSVLRFAYAPKFRCVTRSQQTFVEIPGDWERRFEWTGPAKIAECINNLILCHSQQGKVYVEGSVELPDDHRALVDGWLIPLEAWEAEMREPYDVSFDPSDQFALLAKARSLNKPDPFNNVSTGY